jgi:hypothetical protein
LLLFNLELKNEDHPNQPITKEELEEAHSLLKTLVIEKADALIARSWWPTRVNWKSFRKMMDRQIDVIFPYRIK